MTRGFLSGFVALAITCACSDGSVTPPPGAPNIDLRILNVSSHANRDPGQQVTFTVTVRNLGPITATGILAGDTLPTGLTHVSSSATVGTYSSSTGVWTIGSLDVNQDAVLTLTASVNAGTSGQTLVNQAGVLSSAMNDTVTANNIASASVTVGTAPPPPVGIFFEADWGTATGTSDNALTDGGVFNNVYCGGRSTTLTVVSGASVGFTKTPNVLRLQQLGTTCGMLERLNAIPLSTSHWGRMYFRNDETTSRHNHVMTYFPVGTIQTAIWNRSGTDNGVNIRIRTYYAANGSGAVYPHAHWILGTGGGGAGGEIELDNATWYRYEWHMEYLTPTTYRLWPRIYAMDGTTVLYDHEDFWGGDFTVSLAQFYAGGGSFGFSDVALARNFGIGNEGPASGANSGEYWYHAAIALSTTGWIGQ